MPKVEINGATIHLTTLGQGPAVVLVHGIAANLAFWYPGIAMKLARTHRVVLYDLRGHGRSSMPPSGYTPQDHARDLSGVIDYLGLDEAHIVGHSFGGTVALEYASRFPRRVRTLTLADATVGSLQSIDSGHDWAYWSAWRAELQKIGIDVPAELPRVAFAMLSEIADPRRLAARQKVPAGSDFFMPFGGWNGARRTAERWLTLLRTTAAWKELQTEGVGLEEIRRLDLPTLLIYGERSRWLRTCQLLSEALPHAKAHIIRGAGHFFPLLRPVSFTIHLRAFLKRHGTMAEPRISAAGRRAQSGVRHETV